jgi:hypothetical protein
MRNNTLVEMKYDDDAYGVNLDESKEEELPL